MEQYDILIRNGKILDGLGTPAFYGDIAVKEGKIVKVGKTLEGKGKKEIDAAGCFVTPGFIDGHAHNDGILYHDPSAISKLSQGITTEISGNCGEGFAPVNPKYFLEISSYYRPFFPPKDFEEFTSCEKYFSSIERLPLGINVGYYCPHGIIRMSTMGMDNRPATSAEIEQMKAYLKESLDSGCLGMSTGLGYPPGCFCETEELIELCKVLKEYNATYATHMRSESVNLFASIDETIRIAKESGVRVVISHLKAVGQPQWGKADVLLNKIEQANAQGCDIHFDQYPYSKTSNVVFATIPPEFQEGGVDKLIMRLQDPEQRKQIKSRMRPDVYDWDNPVVNFGYEGIHVCMAEETPDAEHKNIAEYAADSNQNPLDALFEVIIKNGSAAMGAYEGMCEADIETIMKHPLGLIGSDGIAVFPNDQTHPRLYGTFPRVLARYVREKRVLSWEEAVRKMTSLPAKVLGIKNKGQIKEGFDADITVFDPDKIQDLATLEDSQRRADGIPYVIVGGKVALVNKKYTGSASGKLLRR